VELPPKAKPAVCVPAPAIAYLAVFNPVGFDVQVEPSYNSVAPVVGGSPPKANANVCVPQPLKLRLAVFKLPVGFEVQVEPSYSSVAPVFAIEHYHQNLKLPFAFQHFLRNISCRI
jgi:hypothetical protein